MPTTTRRIGALAALAALTLAACGESGSGGGGDDDTYQLGVAMALSGANAALGQDFVRFMEYAAEDANEQYADEGFQIELVTEDTQATAEVGLNALNKLASVEQVPVVFTAWSGVVKAMAPAAEDLGIALFNVGANGPELEGAGENLRNFFPLATVDVEAMATYMADEGGADSAAIIHVNNASGEGASEVYREAFEAAGGEVLAVESIEQDAVDASAQVAKVLAQDPDTVHVQALLGEFSAIFKALEEQGGDDLTVTTYSGGGEAVAVREAAGASMEGVLYSTPVTADPTSPEVTELVDRFREEHGREPAGISYDVFMYDSVFLYADVISQLRADGEDVTGESVLAKIDEAQSFEELPLQKSTTFTDSGTVIKDVRIKRIDDVAANPAADAEVTVITSDE